MRTKLLASGALILVLAACYGSRASIPLQRPALFDPHQVSRDPRYPAHWWTPAPKTGAPSWEILPQEAGPGEVILSKRNELGLLSNFAATPFVYEGKRYASLEGFWQMMKYPEGADDARPNFRGSFGNTHATRLVSSPASRQKPRAHLPIKT